MPEHIDINLNGCDIVVAMEIELLSWQY